MSDIAKELKKHIGITILTRRKMLELTQGELSKLIGVSPRFLGLVEKGERGLSVSKLLKTSAILGCSMDELAGVNEYLRISNNNNVYINCLAEHAKAYQCQNDEDITFLVCTMKYMNEYKSKVKYTSNNNGN